MRRTTRLLVVSSLGLAALGIGASGRAAPPQPAPAPAPSPKVVIPTPSLGSPTKIAAGRKTGSAPYVSGALGLEVEIVNTGSSPLSSTLVIGEKGSVARVPVAVPPNGRAWVGFNDPGGLVNGCDAKTLPASLEGTETAVTLSVQPTCTFTHTIAYPEAQTPDDYIDYARKGKLYLEGSGGRITSPRIRCGAAITGTIRIFNNAPTAATDVRLLFDGNRSNVGTIAPLRGYTTGSFFAIFDGRQGSFRLTLEGSGAPIHSPPWAVDVARSCTVAVSVSR